MAQITEETLTISGVATKVRRPLFVSYDDASETIAYIENIVLADNDHEATVPVSVSFRKSGDDWINNDTGAIVGAGKNAALDTFLACVKTLVE